MGPAMATTASHCRFDAGGLLKDRGLLVSYANYLGTTNCGWGRSEVLNLTLGGQVRITHDHCASRANFFRSGSLYMA